MVIAFAGTGLYDTHTMIVLIVTWWLYKVAMGIVYTPLSYLGIRILRGKNIKESTNEDTPNQN